MQRVVNWAPEGDILEQIDAKYSEIQRLMSQIQHNPENLAQTQIDELIELVRDKKIKLQQLIEEYEETI